MTTSLRPPETHKQLHYGDALHLARKMLRENGFVFSTRADEREAEFAFANVLFYDIAGDALRKAVEG